MAINQDKLHELLGRVVGDFGAAISAALVTVGDKLGLYKALAALGRTDSAGLAKRAGVDERLAREWLLNQAAGGYVSFDPGAGAYFMTEEQKAAFADETGPAFMLGGYDIISSVHRDAPKVAEAFKSGKGLAWGDHDACLFCGTERFFAASYRASLLSDWIPSIDGVEGVLRNGGMAADVGCGHGASTLLMAGAFPKATFVGFDFHPPSIECARKRAAEAGLKNVRFEVADAVSFPAPKEGFDLVACFDCLHDMGDPAGCAKRVFGALKPGGSWMVVEPASADTVAENLNPIGRVFSAASTMICVPASQASGGPALGACAGPKRIHETMRKGGFASARVAASTPFNHVHAARK